MSEFFSALLCGASPILLLIDFPGSQDWTLELEEVYALDREGEIDKYASYRDKLENKMLLWHGML